MIKNICFKIFFTFIFLLVITIQGQQNKEQEDFLLKTRVLIIDEKYEQAEQLLTQALKSKTESTQFKVRVYSNLVMLYITDNNIDKALHYANALKTISSKTNDKLDDAYTNYCFGRIYLLNDLSEKTLFFANEGLKILEKYPNENYLRSELYRIISLSYSRQGEYTEEYRNYLNKELNAIEKTNSYFDINIVYADAVSFYVLAYNKTKNKSDLDKAFEYAEKSINLVNSNKFPYYSEYAKAAVYNNFASLINQYPYKNYTKEKRRIIAKSYLDQAFSIAEKIKIKNLEMICYTTYAELCPDLSCTKTYLEKAYQLAIDRSVNKRDYIKIYLANALKNIYQNENNYNKAFEYSEQELKFSKISSEKINNNRKKLIEAYYDTEQKKQKITELETANKTSNIQKFLFLGMLIFALIGLVFMIYTFRYKQKLNKQKTNILQAEIKESELVLLLEKEEKTRLKAEQDLLTIQQEQLQKQALAVSLQLNHKNTFIKELKEKLKNNDVNIDRILRDERITENDFAEIKDVVHEVHPNFFKKLNSISKTKLTNLDQKYAAYIYINMDNQKISHILKVDPQTVRVTKYRLKQKLGLDKTQDLQLFLQDLV